MPNITAQAALIRLAKYFYSDTLHRDLDDEVFRVLQAAGYTRELYHFNTGTQTFNEVHDDSGRYEDDV